MCASTDAIVCSGTIVNYSHGVNNDVNVLTEAWLVTLAASQGCAVLAPQVLVHLRKAVKLYEADAGRRW